MARVIYVHSTTSLDDLREAVTTLKDTARIAQRVFGGTHPLTDEFETPYKMSSLQALFVIVPANGGTRTCTREEKPLRYPLPRPRSSASASAASPGRQVAAAASGVAAFSNSPLSPFSTSSAATTKSPCAARCTRLPARATPGIRRRGQLASALKTSDELDGGAQRFIRIHTIAGRGPAAPTSRE